MRNWQRSKWFFFASVLTVTVVTLVIYYPASKIGFVNIDWILLDRVARWDLPTYFYHYIVPGAESGWYRPVHGFYFYAMFSLFGANPSAYHWGYVVFHLINVILLLTIVWRISGKFILAVVVGLVYAGFPAYSRAVYWPSDPNTIVMVFYLSAILFWVAYLQKGARRFALATFLAFILALLTKEASMTLPVALFLIDRWIVRGVVTRKALIRRYIPFTLVWLPYLATEYLIQKSGSYVSAAGYGLGAHMFWNMVNSIATLIFPWGLDDSLKYFVAALGVAGFLAAIFWSKNRSLAFLGAMCILNLAPVIGFPNQWFEMRYLYSVAMATATIFGAVLLKGRSLFKQTIWYSILTSIFIGGMLLANGTGVASAISDWGEIARVRAVPFRDIQRSHPVFPNPTKLFFVDPPITSVYDLSVMFLLRYGTGVIVDGTDDNEPNHVAQLRQAPVSYVYYFDVTGKPIEVPVAQDTATFSTPNLPVVFSAPIELVGYEVTNNSLKRDQTVILFLYWRASDRMEKDYTTFVHLLDNQDRTVVSIDSPPQGGRSPTSAWMPNFLIVDKFILQIPSDAPVGQDYHVEVGMYSLESGERIGVRDSAGQSIMDKIVIAPFEVTE